MTIILAMRQDRRGYYSVNIGAWHVISRNSNLRLTAFAAQLAWLKADLDQHKTRCTLAYWHHPVYSSGGHGNNAFTLPVWQALVAADADVVLVSPPTITNVLRRKMEMASAMTCAAFVNLSSVRTAPIQ